MKSTMKDNLGLTRYHFHQRLKDSIINIIVFNCEEMFRSRSDSGFGTFAPCAQDLRETEICQHLEMELQIN